MQKFLKTLLLFCLLFLACDFLFSFLLENSADLEVDKRIEKILNGEIKEDIIIMGSSRGARNIIASQIEDSTNYTAFNLSFPGSAVTFHEFLLKSLVRFNKSPKILLLALDDRAELIFNPTLSFRFDRLYPLVKYDYINNEMIQRDKKNFLAQYINLLRGNKANLDLRKKGFSELDSIQEDGSMIIYAAKKGNELTYSESARPSYEIDSELPEKVEAFLSIQKICSEHNIKLIYCYSPNFYSFDSNFRKRIKGLQKPNNYEFCYDTLNPIYRDKSLYFDRLHLRKKGAVIFTSELSNYLKGMEHMK